MNGSSKLRQAMRGAVKPFHFWICAALAIYLFFSLVYLNLPGLEYDETLFVNAALGNVDGTFVDWHPIVLGKHIPLMLMSYIGALKAFLYSPIFALFGTSPATARFPVVVAGLITLLVTYALVRRLLGRNVAVLTLLLLAADPTFIFANKLDWGPVSLMLLLQASSLYFIWRWMEEGRSKWLLIGSLLLGLGLYNKVIFIWYVAALPPALLLCFSGRVKRLLTPGRLMLALGTFLLGCLPLIAFNIAVPMATFNHRAAMTQDWSSSIKYRYRLFRTTLDGSAIYDVVNHASVAEGVDAKALRDHARARFATAMARLPRIEGSLMPVGLVLSLLLIIVLLLLKRLERKAEVIFILLLFGFMVIFISVTQEATGPHHTIAAYPFPHVLIGLALCRLSRLGNQGNLVRGLVAVLGASPLLFTQLVIDAHYVESFVVKGGVGAWSDAIYQLAAFAKQHPDETFLLMDWGFSTQLLLLSDGKIKKEEAFVPMMYLPAEEKVSRLKPLLADVNSFFVFHAPPVESFPLFDAFRLALDRYGVEAQPIRTFYQRDGRPIYLVYRVLRHEIENLSQGGRFFYLREAEEFDAKSGGGLDLKRGASRNKALGNFWGGQVTDFVVYRFSLPRRISHSYLYLRYAFQGDKPRQYNLFIDGNFIETFSLRPTPGFGYSSGEWRLYGIRIGALDSGSHELRLTPAVAGEFVNLDYFYLCEGEFWFDPVSAPRAQ